MKVLLNDGMDEEGLKLFEEAGIETDTRKRKSEDELVSIIRGFDGLTVRSATKVTKKVIETGALGKLQVIGRGGVDYENVDLKTASDYCIPVINAPHGNTNATAEHAFALMLAVSRNVPQAHYSLKNGKWLKKKYEGTEISRKTLGIIGCGRIGQRLSELVKGSEMKVIGYDINLKKVREDFPESRIEYLSKEEVISESDYLSIHSSGKEVVLGEQEIQKMKPTAFIINTARGSRIDEEALYNALKEKRVAGAALDVFEDEPNEGEDFIKKFRELENVVMTSHLGASTAEAQRKTSVEMAEKIINFLKEGRIKGGVNVVSDCDVSHLMESLTLVKVVHEDKPGMLNDITSIFRNYEINIADMPSIRFKYNGKQLTQFFIETYKAQEKYGSDILEIVKKEISGMKLVYRITD